MRGWCISPLLLHPASLLLPSARRGPFGFSVLPGIASPENLLSNKADPLQHFTITPHTHLTLHLNINHFRSLWHLLLPFPATQVSPPWRSHSSATSPETLQKCCWAVTFRQILCLLSSSGLTCTGGLILSVKLVNQQSIIGTGVWRLAWWPSD